MFGHHPKTNNLGQPEFQHSNLQPESPEEYEKGKAKIFRGPREFMFAIVVGAIGGMIAQIYAHKVLKRQGEV